MGKIWRCSTGLKLRWYWLKHRFYSRSAAERFTAIYNGNLWGNPESRSGWGSTLGGKNGTQATRRELPELCRNLGIRSLLDVPCGDFNWMATVDLDGVQYTGMDIVPEIVSENAARTDSKTHQFLIGDVRSDDLPVADLVMVRDLLIHLTNEDAAAVLRNVARSGATWLLISNYRGVRRNRNTFTGGLRLYNLYKRPFRELRLPDPAHRFVDGDGSRGREMIVVRLR